MKFETDILFVTYMEVPRDTGDPSVYKPLRLHVEDVPAVIPLLRVLAGAGEKPQGASGRKGALGAPPVLTPIYLQEYARKRGLKFLDVPCLAMAMEQVEQVLARGVGLIALSSTWLPHPGGAAVLRKAAAALRELAPDVPIIAGGVGVRKGLAARERLQEGRLPGISRDDLAQDYLLIDPQLDSVLDAVVTCEGGEATMAEVAQRLRDGKDFRNVPNLALPEDGDYRFTAGQSETVDLDEETVDWRQQKHRLSVFDAPVRGPSVVRSTAGSVTSAVCTSRGSDPWRAWSPSSRRWPRPCRHRAESILLTTTWPCPEAGYEILPAPSLTQSWTCRGAGSWGPTRSMRKPPSSCRHRGAGNVPWGSSQGTR